MSRVPSNALLWFGVIGGPAAFTADFVASIAFGFAQCDDPAGRWQLPVHSWQAALAAAGALVTLASIAVALRIFLRTFRIDDAFVKERRGTGSAPPLGRVHFLSIVGLVVNFLVLAIMVMTGIGAPLLSLCHQS